MSITQPAHYHAGKIDVIKFSEENFTKEELKGFYRMNVLKYVTRFDKKNGLEDLEKAAFYLDKLKAMESEPVEQTKPENELSTFLRSLSDMQRGTDWVNYFVPNEVNTYQGGTNEND